MNHKKTFNRISLLFFGTVLCLSPLRAEESESTEGTTAEVAITPQAEMGKAYFQGTERFENGGPSCITCHNVTHDGVYSGGLFAKDLTDYFETGILKDGLSGWLGAPDPPAMAASYNNNPLNEEERMSLTAFLKYASATRANQQDRSALLGLDMAQVKMLVYGAIGLIVLFGAVTVLWSNRKKKMVKNEIFARQNKAWDAKF